jgi:transcription initiation factor TFIIA large subunit
MKLYHSVIEDVIAGVRDSFLDEGVDEQVLQELKQIWETKLLSSKALELNPEPPEPQPPQIGMQKDSRVNIPGKAGLYLNLSVC